MSSSANMASASKKKVDPRVRSLLAHCVSQNQRAFFVIIGDRGREQLVNLNFMLTKLSPQKRGPVLWCYKKELGFKTHNKSRKRELKKRINSGQYDPNVEDPFELFTASTDIRYTYYKDSESVLGKTFTMAVLQDFEALTPNILCRTVETVAGGGLVILLLKNMESLRQLYQVSMDFHSKLKSDAHKFLKQDVEPRFNERLILSLTKCDHCLVVDDELNILPIAKNRAIQGTLGDGSSSGTAAGDNLQIDAATSKNADELEQLREDMKNAQPLAGLLEVAKTLDQAKAVLQMVDAISEKSLNQTVTLTAGRGRGKSATLGLCLAAALAHGYSNIFVTAPSPQNLTTVFEFLLRGFDKLGYKEHQDYDIFQSDDPALHKAVVRVNVRKHQRQTIQYVAPDDHRALAQAELLVIDEAAAIPLPVVKQLLGPYLVMLSSTVNGYEGTGRSLSLKLIADLKKKSALRKLHELTLTEPIRYGEGDSVETWLNELCCLSASESVNNKLSCGLPPPDKCELFLVNRDALFSYHSHCETFLNKLMGLFVASHYKNTPDDLLLLADAPGHFIFVLLAPQDDSSDDDAAAGNGKNAGKLPDIMVAIHCCAEGSLQRDAIRNAMERGLRPTGDLISWTVGQSFSDDNFGTLKGLRVVRVATHPALQRKGYGAAAVAQLSNWFDLKMVPAGGYEDEDSAVSSAGAGGKKEETKEKILTPTKRNQALLAPVADTRPPFALDYIGTSFGVTVSLYEFWRRNGFFPVFLSQKMTDVTGEHSSIMLRLSKALSEDGVPVSQSHSWLGEFHSDFRNRLFGLLGGSFKKMPIDLAISLLDPKIAAQACSVSAAEEGVGPTVSSRRSPVRTLGDLLSLLTRHDLRRIERYANNRAEWTLILDLVPTLAELYFLSRLRTAADNHESQQDAARDAELQMSLPASQAAVLLGLGGQRKTVDDLSAELSIPVSQVLALFAKTIQKFWAVFYPMLEEDDQRKTAEGSSKTTDGGKKRARTEDDAVESGADKRQRVVPVAAGANIGGVTNTLSLTEEQRQAGRCAMEQTLKQFNIPDADALGDAAGGEEGLKFGGKVSLQREIASDRRDKRGDEAIRKVKQQGKQKKGKK